MFRKKANFELLYRMSILSGKYLAAKDYKSRLMPLFECINLTNLDILTS